MIFSLVLSASTAYHVAPLARCTSARANIGINIGMNIRWGGKGFGGGEATRDPDPTYIDPNDPKGKQQAIHKAETFAEYMAKRSAGTSDDVDPIMNQPCYMLPYDDFPGQPSWVVGGEMEITELEDDSESRTQLFLNPDNTVTGGATDGPPPESLCGLWQCGSHSFQMVLQRTFARDPSAMPMTTGARPMDGQLIYTVTRVYIGTVDESRNGPEAVTGKMIFMPQDEYTPVADPNSILWEDDTYGLSKRLPRAAPAILLIFPRTPHTDSRFFYEWPSDCVSRLCVLLSVRAAATPIGYFSIDGNTGAELYAEQQPGGW